MLNHEKSGDNPADLAFLSLPPLVDRHRPVDRSQWLHQRRSAIGASEVPALFDMHPYLTRYALWAEKTARIDAVAESVAMRRGRFLEEPALRMLQEERPAWRIIPNPIPGGHWFLDDSAGFACTPDAFAIDPDRRGYGIVQVKSVHPGAFRAHWVDEDSLVTLPPHVALQACIERHLTGAAWAVVVALVIDWGIEVVVAEVPDAPGLGPRCREEVQAFWNEVAADTPPTPDYQRDLAVISQVYRAGDQPTVTLEPDPELIEALNTHAEACGTIKILESQKARAAALIRARLGDHEGAMVGNAGRTGRGGGTATSGSAWRLSCRPVTRKAYTVTETTYRSLRITEIH